MSGLIIFTKCWVWGRWFCRLLQYSENKANKHHDASHEITSLPGTKPGSFTLEWCMKSCFLPETTRSTGTLIPTKPCADSYPKELWHITLRSLGYCFWACFICITIDSKAWQLEKKLCLPQHNLFKGQIQHNSATTTRALFISLLPLFACTF